MRILGRRGRAGAGVGRPSRYRPIKQPHPCLLTPQLIPLGPVAAPRRAPTTRYLIVKELNEETL